MADENWFELARVIPWTEADQNPPPDYNEAEGNPVVAEPAPVVPHIILQDQNDPEKGTIVVEIPKENYDAIVALLESGEMSPGDLSTLPLSDLVPSAAEL